MARPFFHYLNQVSEEELRAIPPGRGGAQLGKFSASRGGSPKLSLLTAQKSNAKTNRNATSPNLLARRGLEATLALSPSGTSGFADTCGHCSTPGCRENCLSDSGRYSSDRAQLNQRIKTEFGVLHADLFLAALRDEQRTHAENAWAVDMHPVFRRNTLSDVPYQRLKTAPILIGEYEEHPSGIVIPRDLKHLAGATTSEYSKEDMIDVVDNEEVIPYRSVHITPSLSERTTIGRAKQVLESGRNIAVPVLKTKKDELYDFLTIRDASGETLTNATFDMDRDDARWADQEKGMFGVLSEKKRGTLGSGAYSLNPHTNVWGFKRANEPGRAEDVPVRIRRMHFDDGRG